MPKTLSILMAWLPLIYGISKMLTPREWISFLTYSYSNMPFVTREKEFKIVVGFLLLGISLLWIYKFPYLGLPYFWDEGWSYATAVYRMSTQNLCLLPSCLDPELSRGHPLLFYFMNAAVAKVFGFSPLVMHAFSLIVAWDTLVVFFFILLRFTNPVFALLGTWLLLMQEVFMV